MRACILDHSLWLVLKYKDGREVFRWSSVVEGLSYSEKHLRKLQIYPDEPLFLSHSTALTKLRTKEVSLFGFLGQDLLDRPDNGSPAVVDAVLERLPPQLTELFLEDCTVDTLRYFGILSQLCDARLLVYSVSLFQIARIMGKNGTSVSNLFEAP